MRDTLSNDDVETRIIFYRTKLRMLSSEIEDTLTKLEELYDLMGVHSSAPVGYYIHNDEPKR